MKGVLWLEQETEERYAFRVIELQIQHVGSAGLRRRNTHRFHHAVEDNVVRETSVVVVVELVDSREPSTIDVLVVFPVINRRDPLTIALAKLSASQPRSLSLFGRTHEDAVLIPVLTCPT